MQGTYMAYGTANNINVAALANAIFANTSLGLWIGATGNLHCQIGIPQRNSEANNKTFFTNAVFANIPAGTLLPIRVNLIYTDSTVNSVVVLF